MRACGSGAGGVGLPEFEIVHEPYEKVIQQPPGVHTSTTWLQISLSFFISHICAGNHENGSSTNRHEVHRVGLPPDPAHICILSDVVLNILPGEIEKSCRRGVREVGD